MGFTKATLRSEGKDTQKCGEEIRIKKNVMTKMVSGNHVEIQDARQFVYTKSGAESEKPKSRKRFLYN